MAFTTTTREDLPKKGIWRSIDVLKDTAGVGTAHQLPDAVHITLEAIHTGTAGTITLTASNNGVNFFVLPTTSITFAVDGIKAVVETDRGYFHYRAELSGGDATTVWTLTWICKIRQAGTP